MRTFASSLIVGSGLAVSALALLIAPGALDGQTPTSPAKDAGRAPEPLNWTTQQDHKNMMDQLEIKTLRPGPSGRAGATHAANYNPAKANPYPNLPDPLTLRNGQKVTTAEMWWKQRRPEIVEDFEREVIGRVPKTVPKVTWAVVSNVTDGLVGTLLASGKQLVGHVDNLACPAINVDIRMTVVTPAKAKEPVPVLMMFGGFGGGGIPRPAGSPAPTNRVPEFGGPFKDPPATEQLLAAGPVFRLLGAKDIGEREDYRTAKMPPVNTGLLDGELAWRQHDGGHEDRSNMKHFIAWANRLLQHTPPAAVEVK